MMNEGRTYLCIDLKSFYASVECAPSRARSHDHQLVVADPERSNTTICLAVTPALKKLGVRNDAGVFEIPEHRLHHGQAAYARLHGGVGEHIQRVPALHSPEDMHVYSIDECFIDATPYLSLYGKTPKELAGSC